MNEKQEAIRAEIEKCRKHGVVKAEDIIRRAKNAKSMLHDCFTWDDSEAAHQWRLIQARQLMIRVQVTDIEGANPVRAFVSLTSDRTKPGGGYRALADVMDDSELYNRLRQDAFTQLQNMQLKYRRIVELEPVWTALDNAQRQPLDNAA